jgi:general secretion pathway protein K
MRRGQKGGALLAVLWLSAALSAIAFSVAQTVRGETERTSTLVEGVRSYYLAAGAIERMLLYMDWTGYKNADNTPMFYERGMPHVLMNFPSGTALVEIIPESAKLNLNTARPEELLALLVQLGVDPGRAREIAMAIVDWRTPAPPEGSPFDAFYMSLVPSFRARHASFQEIEELLLVRGMTPELFYGTFVRDSEGRLLPQAGLKDCLSIYGTQAGVDINFAQPAVLAAIGVNPAAVAAIIQRRHALPFRKPEEVAEIAKFAGPGGARLTIGGRTVYTLRATGRLRLPDGRTSDLSRTVSALMVFHEKPVDTPRVEMLRWYDN